MTASRPLLYLAIVSSSILPAQLQAQDRLSLKDALKIALDNYGIIKAKTSYAQASKAAAQQARLDYLPNLNLSAQADYGPANGQNGPLYAFGAPGIATSGTPTANQNWNAAFGALYLTNVNWDFFAFGRSKQKIRTAETAATKDDRDTRQEMFEHQVRVAAAYLNLLAAQRLTESYRRNLDRADTLRNIIVIKAKQDLVAGVDSSQANSEVSNARSTLLKAMNYEDELNSTLIRLLGITPKKITADTVFIAALPKTMPVDRQSDSIPNTHPVLQYYQSRITLSEEQAKYYRTLAYPTFSIGAVFDSRGSGFGPVSAAGEPYTSDFFKGIKPDRTNYVFALGITWNITQPLRIKQQVRSQQFINEGLRSEMEQTRQELAAQLLLSDSKIRNAIADYYETPIQVKAASDTWVQKTVLYNAGLTSLVDVTQALYALIRAETDRDIAYSNVWQALLLKAASLGDFTIFSQNL